MSQLTPRQKSFWASNKWLLLRRSSQFAILGLFLLGPLAGVWLIKGNLSSSLLLETVPMSDPYLLLQVLFTGHLPESAALIGGVIVLVFYLLVGGRSYCGWVCPINIVTDGANWLQRRLAIQPRSSLSRNLRFWLLALTLLLALFGGTLLWELVNPVTLIQRGLIYGSIAAWGAVLALFLYELLVSQRGWCSRLCPTGAFYSLLTIKSPLRISVPRRSACDDCMDCYKVCPEPQIIKPVVKGGAGSSTIIDSSVCTNCGRCIDVCNQHVFQFSTRFNHREDPVNGEASS